MSQTRPSDDPSSQERWQKQEDILDRFEQAWRAGQRPDVESYRPGGDDRAVLVELIRTDLEFRRKAGETVRVDEYLRRFPELAGDRDFVHELQAEAGISAPTPEEGKTVVATNGRRSGPIRVPPSIPGFEILEELGRGGMGVVYKARHLRLGRLVALKVIRSEQIAPEALKRFHAEARAVAALQHPHIVQIHEAGEHAGVPYLVLEYVDGGNLARSQRPLEARRAAALIGTLARAVHAAHERGIIHRDLKPANVLLTADGAPKLTDFGLAKHLQDDAGQTQSGAILGTPAYMAPEQAAAKMGSVGCWTDVYALGAILYELLTGRPPFQGGNAQEVIQQVLADEAMPPKQVQPTVPLDLDTICRKCLHKEPVRRYASALDLADDLRRFLEEKPIHARPASAWERVRKWARRHPAWAACLAVCLLSVLALGWAAVWFTAALHDALEQRTQELRDEQQQRERETRQRQRERDQETQTRQRRLRHDLFMGDIRLAQRFLHNGQTAQARDLLARHQGPEDEELRGFELDYLRWLCNRSEPPLEIACRMAADHAALSPDGKTLAVADWRNPIQLWDVATWQPRTTLPASSSISDFHKVIAYSPDGSMLAALDANGTLKLWDAAGKERATLNKGEQAFALAFSRSGALLALAKPNGIRIWKTVTLEELLPPSVGALSVVFGRDDNTLILSGRDGVIRIADLATKSVRPLRHPQTGGNLKLSHDGATLAVASAAGSLSLLDFPSGRRLFDLADHEGGILSLSFSPNDRFLVSGGDDGSVRLWDTRTGKAAATYRAARRAVIEVLFDGSGQKIISTSHDRHIRVWSPFPKAEHETLRTGRGPVGPVAFSRDGKLLAVANRDHTVNVTDVTTGRLQAALPPHYGEVRCLAWYPDGMTVATAAADGFVRVWHLGTQSEAPALALRHQGPVEFVVCSPDGRLLATAGTDRRVKLWDARTGKEQVTLVDFTDEITTLGFAPDGRTLAIASMDKTVKLWDVAKSQWRGRLDHADGVLCAAYSHDGRWLVSGAGGNVTLWDAALGRSLAAFRGHSAPMGRLAWSADDRLLAGVEVTGAVRTWDATTRRMQHDLDAGARGAFPTLAFSPVGRLLALIQRTGRLGLWDLQEWRVRQPLGQNPGPVHALAFTPDSRSLVTLSHEERLKPRLHEAVLGVSVIREDDIAGSTDDVLGLWRVDSGEPVARLTTGHTGSLKSLAISPAGRLTAGGEGGTIWQWDTELHHPRPPRFVDQKAENAWRGFALVKAYKQRVCPDYKQSVVAIAVSPDGRALATASEDNAGMPHDTRPRPVSEHLHVKLWDAEKGMERPRLLGRFRHVRALTFSPDGRTLASNDGVRIHLWDVATGQQRPTLEHGDMVYSLAFSPAGDLLASAGQDGKIKLWYVAEGKVRAQLLGHTKTVASVAFSPDGKTLASGSWDNTVKLWKVASGQDMLTLEAHTGKVHVVAFSPDGYTLASGGESPEGGGEVYLWRADSSNLPHH